MNFRSDIDKGSSQVEMRHTHKEKLDLHMDKFDGKGLHEVVQMLESAGVDMERYRVTKYDKDTNTLTLTRITTMNYHKGSLVAQATFKNGEWSDSPIGQWDRSLKRLL